MSPRLHQATIERAGGGVDSMEKQRRQKFLDAMDSYDKKLDSSGDYASSMPKGSRDDAEGGAKPPAPAKKEGPQDCPVQ